MRTLVLTALAIGAIAAPATAQQAGPMAYGAPIGAAAAQKLVAASVAEAAKRNFTMAFTVVEPSGAMVLFHKMDGTQYGSIDVSQGKARSSAMFKRPTKALADSASTSVGILTLGVVAVEGGLPIIADGRIVGALGVSGGTSVQDGEVGKAALQAAGFTVP